MDEQLKQALQKVTRFLEINDLQYAVVGGIALSSWNVSRFTHDIDGWLSQFAEALESPELLARYQILRAKVQQMLV
jgi:hypothetical protein